MDNYIQLALIALVSGIVGYIIGRISMGSSGGRHDEKWKLEIESYKEKNASLQAEIERLESSVSVKASNFAEDVSISNSDVIFDVKAVKTVFGKSYKQDDLKIVDGIGPKIEELFKTSGILTWKSLGETSVDRLREILSKAGDSYQIHDPSTWPRQSKLAFEGKWQELKDWQDVLDGGREV